jgi:hypothetical protein
MADDIPVPGSGDDTGPPQIDKQQQQQQVPPLRTCRTHVSQDAIVLCKTLPLYNKLKVKKKIELENIGWMNKSIHHAFNSVNYLTVGSDVASLITIIEEELADLLDDSICNCYKDVLPISIVKWISDTQKAQGEPQVLLKRSFVELSLDVHAKLLEA